MSLFAKLLSDGALRHLKVAGMHLGTHTRIRNELPDPLAVPSDVHSRGFLHPGEVVIVHKDVATYFLKLAGHRVKEVH